MPSSMDQSRSTQMHLNMMTDTLIANLPADGLRVIVRYLIAAFPSITSTFEDEARRYVAQHAQTLSKSSTESGQLENVLQTQGIIRCMLGSGMVFNSLPLLAELATQAARLKGSAADTETTGTLELLKSIDGDVVQAMTAVEKARTVSAGSRKLTDSEQDLIRKLYDSLIQCQAAEENNHQVLIYERGISAVSEVLGLSGNQSGPNQVQFELDISQVQMLSPSRETFRLGNVTLPRIFSGLWQLSSPSWGSASSTEIMKQFGKHVASGFSAFDMADHYGDAEVVFGRFRSLYPHKQLLFAATKFCVFQQMVVSLEAIKANVSERCRRLQQDRLDLLQFHWQHYDMVEYIDALRYLQEDSRVGMIGLCNFDTINMQRVIDSGIKIYSNQVQFSLVDARPIIKMAEVCIKHDVKLLTYGTLCGGFLSEKWLDKPEPDLYGGTITPSQRKYYSMICNWGGWSLFQELLQKLKEVATKHQVSVSNVATRWVLDFPYVGAVIVGARMGLSDHSDDNIACFGWNLDEQDQQSLEEILQKSKRTQMFEQLGDCGAEYRS